MLIEEATRSMLDTLIPQAQAGELVLVLAEGAVCQRCSTQFMGKVGACGCDMPGPHALVRGQFAIDGTLEPMFHSNDYLRTLAGTGMRIVDDHGTDVTLSMNRQH